jgi:co-chaperonin GroES (HSP10)
LGKIILIERSLGMISTQLTKITSKKGDDINIKLQEGNGTWAPAPGYLLVLPIEATQGESLIIIPEGSQPDQNQGTVLAITLEEDKDKSFCEIGDVVLYSKFSPKKITINGKELYFINRKDIHGILS